MQFLPKDYPDECRTWIYGFPGLPTQDSEDSIK